MRDVLREANAAVRAACAAGARALPPKQAEAFVDRYWTAVRMGLVARVTQTGGTAFSV